ncbi:MAG: carboxypeptidase-like regulatory domain-containing protein, partial [Bacteroidota bacterium]|nr:carboxypeptidase-like regulatory domain-containing protein [Bacteroidota bacterium]
MKLTAILLFIVCVTFGNSFSQVRLTVRFEKTDIRDVLQTIEEKTDFIFLYKDEIFDFSKKVSADFTDAKFEEVLKTFCDQANVSCEIRDRQIILKEKGVTPLQNAQQPQKKEISGTVKDSNGLPLPGVSVVVKGTTSGTITDADGKFTLAIPADAQTLQFSFVGMKMQEVPIAGKTIFDILLQDETVVVEDVVVVAFGTQKKATITGSISSIQTQEIKQSPAANLAITLAGRLPGLTAIQRTGEPGRELVQLYIRGIGTVNAQSPIILVDGVERELTFIDPNEVASITILKDASSTAIFGVRGANGVILVTTKRGTSEKPEINFSSEFSAQDFTRNFSSVNAFEYATLRNLAQRNDGLGYAYSAEAV